MSQTTDSKLIALADGVTVKDAFVDWKVNCSNPPALMLRTNGEIGLESFEPFERSGSDGRMIEMNDYGVYHGVQPHCPVSEETGAATTSVDMVDGELEIFESLHHTVKRDVNEMAPQTAVSVVVNPEEGYVSEWALDVATVNVIVERYLNGQLGSDTLGYWLWKREPHEWRRATTSRDEHESYEGSTVRLVADEIYTWYPEEAAMIDADDEVYTP